MFMISFTFVGLFKNLTQTNHSTIRMTTTATSTTNHITTDPSLSNTIMTKKIDLFMDF
jgi:hypothetical protein